MGTGTALKKREKPLDARREKFIAILRQTGNAAEASRLMKMSPNLPYTWKRQSEAFKEAFAVALAEGHEALADRLECALTTRAEEGWTEGVYYKGEKVGEQLRYSDVGAIVMLKSLRPERFIEQMVGVSVHGQQLTVKIMNFSALPAPPPLAGPGAGDSTSHERPPSPNVRAAPNPVEESLQS
jgi:hypothetical protein